MGLDDPAVLWKPHPSHVIYSKRRERSLVSPTPFLKVLRENVGSKMDLVGIVVIHSPWVCEQYVIGHVLADRWEVDTSGDT